MTVTMPKILGKKYRPKTGRKLGKVTHIVLHYSATYPDKDISAEDLNQMHLARGWACIGYHYVITRDGRIWYGRDSKFVGAHVGGQNAGKIGICCVGGIDRATGPDVGVDNRTEAQKYATIRLVHWLKQEHGHPTVCGHRDLKPTQCPGFDVGKWWTEVHTTPKFELAKPNPPIQKHSDFSTDKPAPQPTPKPSPKPSGNWFTRLLKAIFG